MFRSTMSLTLVLLAGSMAAAADLKSGPKVGEGRYAFFPLWLNGDQAGKERCPV